MPVPLLELVQFALVMAAGQFSPGPDMLLILKNSVSLTTRAALFTVLGITTGIVVHTTVILAGLAAVIEHWPRAFRVFWIAGGFYLAWLGLQLIVGFAKGTGGMETPCQSTSRTISGRTAFAQGFLTNITNPKVMIFFAGILAASLPPGSPGSKKLMLGGIIVGEALVLWSLFVLLLKWPPVARCYQRVGRSVDLTFGILLLWVAGGVLWRELQ